MKTKSNIQSIVDFLELLTAHNDRVWFKDHKGEFDAVRKPWEDDVQRLIDVVSQWDDSVRGLTSREAVFRIYRDTRFSHNKLPYKTHFGAVIGPRGRHAVQACSYLHLEPGNCFIAGGVWWPERPILQQMRSLIDAEGDEFVRIISHPDVASEWVWECDSLKKMPQGYDPAHPLAQFLKMKEYILVKHVDTGYFACDDWVDRVASDMKKLQPFYDFLNYIFD